MANYNAFISYSRSADGDLAPALQAGLQRLAKPWSRRRALEVFRDETGLAVTPDLWASITEALDASEWFVLLASPLAAESRWVNQEIERWLANAEDGADRILPVLTSGTMQWDLEAGDFTDDSDAVPPALLGAYRREPRYIDLTWAGDATVLNLENERFRQVVAEIAAPLHGVGQDELIGEDVLQHRRSRRVRWIATSALVLLAALLAVVGFLAIRSQRDADDTAARKASTDYARQSSRILRDDPEVAALLAVEAWWPDEKRPGRQVRTTEGESALRVAINELRHAEVVPIGLRIDTDAAPTAIAVHPNDETVAAIDAAGTVTFWDLGTGLADPRLDPIVTGVAKLTDWGAPQVFEFSPDGRYLLTASGTSAVTPDSGAVVIVDVAAGGVAEVAAAGPATWLPDGSFVATVNGGAVVRFSDAAATPESLLDGTTGRVAELVTVSSGELVVAGDDGGAGVIEPAGSQGVRSLDYPTGQEDAEDGEENEPLVNFVWAGDPSGDRLYRYSFQRRFDPFTGASIPTFDISAIDVGDPGAGPSRLYGAPPVAPGTLQVAPDGRWIAAVDGEAGQGMSGAESGVLTFGRFVQIWATETETVQFRDPIRIETNEATDVAWRSDDNVLVVASRSGIQSYRVRRDLPANGAVAFAVADTTGRVASWDGQGEVSIVDGDDVAESQRHEAGFLEGDAFDVEPYDGAVALSADGTSLLLTGEAGLGRTETLDLATGDRRAFAADEALRPPASRSPVDDRIAFATGQIVQASTGETLGRFSLDDGDGVVDLRWTSDGSSVVILTTDGNVSEHVVETGETVVSGIAARGATSFVLGLDDTIAIGFVDGSVDIVDRATLETLQSIRVQRSAVTAVDLSDDGSHILTAGGSIGLHDLSTGDEVWSSDDVPSFEEIDWWLAEFVGEDGQIAAASPSRSVRVFVADPAETCGLVGSGAFDRFEQIVGHTSACERIEELSTARSNADPASASRSDRPPLQTVPTTTMPIDEFFDEFLDDSVLDEPDDAVFDVVAENVICPSFAANETFPIIEGQRGMNVAIAQHALAIRGYPLVPDGCFGPNTRTQISAYQDDMGVAVSGALDDATWERLVEG